MTVPLPRLRVLTEVLACSGIPTQLLLTGLLTLAGIRPLEADGTLSLRFLVLMTLIDTLLLVGLVQFFLHACGETVQETLLPPQQRRADLRLGLLLTPVLLVGVSLGIALLRWLWPALATVPTNPFEALANTPGRAVLLGVVAMVAGGLREEMQRGFLLHRFRNDLGGALPGLIITSAAFGLGHVMQGWDAAVVTAGLGAVWGAVFLTHGSIGACLFSHAATNGVQVLAAYLMHQSRLPS
ncbi:MAG: CPBP family intramembrane metalloprotease [Acidobacteria bacterium]|nr:CPBP family intramembrane metalloprotease [Acidobacteriota bacterium]